MQMHLKGALAGAAIAVAFLAACADPGTTTAPVSFTFDQPSLVIAPNPTPLPEPVAIVGRVVICKAGNASGSFTIGRTNFNSSGFDQVASPIVIANGTCQVVATDATPTIGNGSVFTVTEGAPPANTVQSITRCRFKSADAATEVPCTVANGGPLSTNLYHGWVITYTNTFTPPPPPPPPPPAICDFITFGRLVTEVGGQKVVISGNAGGNNADGSIKNEFQIQYLGVTYHVADAITYGPIASGPLSGPAFPNSRVVTGIAKNGVAVELRLWDGGEPGKGTDKVWFRLGPPVNATIGGANGQFIDQGNMQYHSNCRGPG